MFFFSVFVFMLPMSGSCRLSASILSERSSDEISVDWGDFTDRMSGYGKMNFTVLCLFGRMVCSIFTGISWLVCVCVDLVRLHMLLCH
ncbi:hypothetical protein BZA05DRAFT_399706 [Tricharina praecox]|uniref:uncharacterized protein n=1 Tax=Tricharina praecox TaxID=43433 RepID=UPI00221E9BCC|nr:uncharacterized protein BZA05DRAFT_399706 [Tricharina praecox]KAI5850610.1 hypothetical protein BZA05DRAFT_399706 [Tricharina praecox]